jgi:hypothetical protein
MHLCGGEDPLHVGAPFFAQDFEGLYRGMRIPIGKERTVVKVDPPPFEGGARASYQAEQFLVEEPPEVVKERAADLFRREWRYGGQWGYGRNYVWLQGANMGWFSLLFRDQENAAVAFVRRARRRGCIYLPRTQSASSRSCAPGQSVSFPSESR